MAANGVKEATVSFAELSLSEALPIVIVSPAGKTLMLQMRTLKADEIVEVRKSMPARPQARVKDMRRNAQGQIERILDEDDPVYVAALDGYNQQFGVRCLYRSLVGLDVPGEDDADRAERFERGLDAWALAQLMDHFNRINGFTNEGFSAARAELTPLEDVSTPSSPALVGESQNGTVSSSPSSDVSLSGQKKTSKISRESDSA